MSSDKTFSVATPTRNALHNLRRCVGSFRGQLRNDVEHLIQDACSTDGTPQWLADQSLIGAVSEPDEGMYDAINRAWSRSTGSYLSWLNSDEQYLPGTFNRVDEIFKANPQVDVLFANYIVVDAEGLAVAVRNEIPLRRFLVANTFLNAQSCTLFFRRSLLDRGLLTLDARLRYAADMELVLRLLSQGARFKHIDEVWALFGIDGANLSTHPGAVGETEQVGRAYGALRCKPLRALATCARRTERLLRGSYARRTVTYAFATSARPDYVTFEAPKLGGSYSLVHPRGRARQVAQPANASFESRTRR